MTAVVATATAVLDVVTAATAVAMVAVAVSDACAACVTSATAVASVESTAAWAGLTTTCSWLSAALAPSGDIIEKTVIHKIDPRSIKTLCLKLFNQWPPGVGFY